MPGRLETLRLVREKMYGSVRRCLFTFHVSFDEPTCGRGTERGRVETLSRRCMYDAVVAFVVGYIFANCRHLCGVEYIFRSTFVNSRAAERNEVVTLVVEVQWGVVKS